MHSKLLTALAASAWLVAAGLASADDNGTGTQAATEGTQAGTSNSDRGAMEDAGSTGVEYRRNDRAGGDSRTGRNDRSASDGRTGRGANASETGEGAGGDVD